MNELQEWELSAEMKLEKYKLITGQVIIHNRSGTITDEDVFSLDDVLRRFENLCSLKQKTKNVDFKLIEKVNFLIVKRRINL